MPSPRQVQVVPAALGLEALQLEVESVEIEEGDMPRVRWVWFGAASASPPTSAARLHCLDLRIPIEHDLVLLQVRVCSIAVAGPAWPASAPAPSLRKASPNSVLTPLIVFLRRIVLSFCVPRFLITGSRNSIAVVVGRQALLFQEVAELRHVVGVDAEDAECLQHADVLGPLDVLRELRLAAALEAQVVALEPHAASEELDDLRAFAVAHVHQAHRAHAPAAPALGELLRSDQQVHRRVRLVDLVEERAGKLALRDGQLRELCLPFASRITKLHQLGVVAHIDDAERLVVRPRAAPLRRSHP